MLSGAFVLCNVADEERLSKETHKSLMMTADGFKWPVPKGPGEFTKPNFELDAGRKDELEQPWVRGWGRCLSKADSGCNSRAGGRRSVQAARRRRALRAERW
jgi:hypothetical protein